MYTILILYLVGSGVTDGVTCVIFGSKGIFSSKVGCVSPYSVKIHPGRQAGGR